MKKIQLLTITTGMAVMLLAACNEETLKDDSKEVDGTETPTELVTEVNQEDQVVELGVEETPLEEEPEEIKTPVDSIKEIDRSEQPLVEKQPVEKVQVKPVEKKEYLPEFTHYKGYGENIDTVLEEYTADKVVYGIYYIGEKPILDSKVLYKITEERGLGDKNPVHSGSVKLQDNFARITINCDGACADFPKGIDMHFEYSDADLFGEFIEDYRLEKYTE